MRVAHPGVHDATGEEPRVGRAARGDGERAQAAAAVSVGRPKRRGHEVEPLRDEQQPGARRAAASGGAARSGTRATRRNRRGGARAVAAASAARVSSIRWPNCTPDGHAASHPRHCTHSSIARRNASSIGAARSSTARIAAMRPRGDAISRPVTR